MWIKSCSFSLNCEDKELENIICEELDRTAKYIRAHIDRSVNFATLSLINPDTYLSFCVNKGNVYFGVYNSEHEIISFHSDGSDIRSRLFANSMVTARKQSDAYIKAIKTGQKIPQNTKLLLRWKARIRQLEQVQER